MSILYISLRVTHHEVPVVRSLVCLKCLLNMWWWWCWPRCWAHWEICFCSRVFYGHESTRFSELNKKKKKSHLCFPWQRRVRRVYSCPESDGVKLHKCCSHISSRSVQGAVFPEPSDTRRNLQPITGEAEAAVADGRLRPCACRSISAFLHRSPSFCLCEASPGSLSYCICQLSPSGCVCVC